MAVVGGGASCPPAPPVTRCRGAGAGPGEVEVSIVDPSGRRGTVEATLEPRGDGTYRCSYRPTAEGPHAVHVAFGGAPIPKSPFNVNVGQGEPRGAACAPPTSSMWGSLALSPPRLGVSLLLSPQLGGLCPSQLGDLCPPNLGVSVSPSTVGSLCVPPQVGGLCPLRTWGSLSCCPPTRGSAFSSPPSWGGVSVLPSSGGLCASAPQLGGGGCFCASAPPRALVGGSLPPHAGGPGLSLQGGLGPP